VRTAAGALNNPQYVRRCVEAAAAAKARADAAHPDKAAAREARQLLERSLEDAPGLPCFSYATGPASPAGVVWPRYAAEALPRRAPRTTATRRSLGRRGGSAQTRPRRCSPMS